MSQVHAIWSLEDRKHLAGVIMDPRKVPDGTRVTFSGERKTNAQDKLFHAMIGEIAKQATHNGRRYDEIQWKAIFLQALGQEIEFLPTLDGKSFFPVGFHWSDLSKEEASNGIELVFAWGAEHGVKFKEPEIPPPHGMVAEPPKRKLLAAPKDKEIVF